MKYDAFKAMMLTWCGALSIALYTSNATESAHTVAISDLGSAFTSFQGDITDRFNGLQSVVDKIAEHNGIRVSDATTTAYTNISSIQ